MAKAHLGEFELLILSALLRLREQAYGVAVRREIEQRTGRSVSIGAVYTTLNRLESKGFVSSRTGTPTAERGGRAKRHFVVEPEGRLALAATLSSLERMTEGLALT